MSFCVYIQHSQRLTAVVSVPSPLNDTIAASLFTSFLIISHSATHYSLKPQPTLYIICTVIMPGGFNWNRAHQPTNYPYIYIYRSIHKGIWLVVATSNIEAHPDQTICSRRCNRLQSTKSQTSPDLQIHEWRCSTLLRSLQLLSVAPNKVPRQSWGFGPFLWDLGRANNCRKIQSNTTLETEVRLSPSAVITGKNRQPRSLPKFFARNYKLPF